MAFKKQQSSGRPMPDTIVFSAMLPLFEPGMGLFHTSKCTVVDCCDVPTSGCTVGGVANMVALL